MANNLLGVITLPDDAGSGFEPGSLSGVAGDKIYIYWDDSAEAFVVELENNSATSSSNLSSYADAGNFETADTNPDWGYADLRGGLTRSATQAHAGTYSGLYTAPDDYEELIIQAPTSFTSGKIYNLTCWCYIPSSNPIATSGSLRFFGESGVAVTNLSPVNVANAQDTWVQLTGTMTISIASNPFVTLKLTGGTINTGGLMYIDEFFITEDTGYTSVTNTITSGPILSMALSTWDVYTNGGNYNLEPEDNNNLYSWDSGYSICDLTTLLKFHGEAFSPSFPYVDKILYPNHSACSTPWVCNITFDGVPTITAASDAVTEDGAAVVSASSSGGEIVYFINPTSNPPIYGQSGSQTSGTFSNLQAGTYTIWAVDERQCAINVEVTIPAIIINNPQPTVTNTYSEKYRITYSDIHTGVATVINIDERNFNGTYTEPEVGPTPFVRNTPSNDINNKFDPIRRTSATLTLVSQRDLQFIGLFSQDDRKYRLRYNRAGSEQWRGFLVPSVFSEPYTEYPPYYTELQFTDGLQELEEELFLDRDENKYDGLFTLIKLVSVILDRLDLQLKIRLGVNISEDSHNGVKPFDETQIDVASFYDEDGVPWTCSDVLKSILQPFGAKIVQDGGYWNIVRIEEQTETYNTRIYTYLGVYESSSTYDPVVDISSPTLRINAAFSEANHVMQVVPAYGKITINHKLFPKTSILHNYNFNEESFVNGDFNSWIVDKTNGAGVAVALGEVEELNSSLRIQGIDQGTVTGGKYVTITALSKFIEFSESDAFKFSFKYRININYLTRFGIDISESTIRSSQGPPEWIRIGYKIQVGLKYYNSYFGWTTNDAFKWNYIWEGKFNESVEFKIDKIETPLYNSVTTQPVTISIWVEGNNRNDFQNESGLGAIVTDNTLPIGYKVKGAISNLTSYVLKGGTEATSWPFIKRPDDYATTTNEVYWELTSSSSKQVNSINIDDVVFTVLPNSYSAPKDEIIEIDVNDNFRESLSVDVYGGDVTEEILNSKQYIYNNIFFDQNREYTSIWTRDSVIGESTTLLKILLKSLVNQYRYPTFKFSGSLIAFTDIGFLTTIKHTQPAASLSLTNEEFTGGVTGWSNSGSGTSWAYDSNDVQVTLSGATNSKLFGQSLTGLSGQRISIGYSIERSASSGTRGDWFVCALIKDGAILQEIVLESQMSFDGTLSGVKKFSFTNDFDTISFYIRNIYGDSVGTGDATYDVDYFRLVPLSIVRYYTPNSLSITDRDNSYSGDWMQLIPVVFSSDSTIDDSGEGNTDTEGGGGSGTSGSGGDYNNDYNADYNI
jgi:hypothetical protein